MNKASPFQVWQHHKR